MARPARAGDERRAGGAGKAAAGRGLARKHAAADNAPPASGCGRAYAANAIFLSRGVEDSRAPGRWLRASAVVVASLAMESRVGFFPRLGAALIDFVLLAILAALLKDTVAGLMPGVLESMLEKAKADLPPDSQKATVVVGSMMQFGLAMSVIGPFYGLLEAFTGRSPGKFLLGLVVVAEAGTRAALGQLLGRYGVKQVPGVPSLVAAFTGIKALEHLGTALGAAFILGCFMVFLPHRQALHDKIVKTAVLRKSDLAEAANPAPAT